MQCPAITRKGIPCPIFGEIERDGYCHVHDPNGKFRQQQKARWSDKNIKKIDKAKRKYKRRLENGWLNCEYPECKKLYNPKWKRSKRGYHYCNLHYRVVRSKRNKIVRQRKTKEPGYFVYIFYLGFDNLYKIGRSRKWSQRLTSLKSGNPLINAFAVVKTLTDYKEVERTMHWLFSEYRVEREIFKLDEQALDDATFRLYQFGEAIDLNA